MADTPKWLRIVVAGVVTGAVLYAITGGPGRESEPRRVKAAVPERLDIPSLGLKAPLMKLGLAGDGEVELPPYEKPSTAGWFDQSVVPGDAGPSVIIGHVDTKTAPAVFYRLRELKKGALVKVRRSDGRTAQYRVNAIEQVPKDRFPAERVYADDGLRLVTCGGAFDRRTHEYLDNVIIYTSLIGAPFPDAA
ncbi:class F sortase [Sphaerisporangium siamense]|uniref:LPXTG-site transpeptidase (Sortase) family protein n=1 Tax=Sphaerisporangium siamense TaxID=795645 RepID=A0A7W7DFZ6_9ACTN|nr:class F sortase [Sphaerisporangium siamense]MBB4706082.1 LPXTG-site transpeptidase (sortase) family protein [Sphaerisporangium siamense]GII88563.1 class F sortase [Sphaerisporangium siamense]